VLQEDFMGSDFLQTLHHLFFKVFNLVFKSGDLGGEPVRRDFKVTDYLG
jgi:hypothetical protein